MAIINIFSKRQNELNSESPDCYSYDYFSHELRNKLLYILTDFLGTFKTVTVTFKVNRKYNHHYKVIYDILCREYGVLSLSNHMVHPNDEGYEAEEIFRHIKNAPVDKCLDVFELLFNKFKDNEKIRFYEYSSTIGLAEAIEDFNYRLKEHGIGYRFENGLVFRIDSEFMHSEATKPALEIISRREEYKPALDEFITAHDHYKKNRFSECIVSCGKSLESLLKSIYHLNSWEIKGDNLQKLVAGAFEYGLIPSYLQDQFTEIRKMVSSGVGNIRNKSGAHGKSIDCKDAPVHLVKYLLNLTASNILFISECNEKLMPTDS